MLDTDTFFTAVYTVLDDLYRAHLARVRQQQPGRPPRVSDSEVLTLVVLGHWYRLSERQLLRRVRQEWREYFPVLLSQSAFNRRVRGLRRVLAWLVPQLAQALGTPQAPYEVLDGTAVPVAQLCRGKRSRLFGCLVDVGRGGVGKGWYYGLKLLLSVTPTGTISGFVAGPASTEERWLAEALFAGRATALAAPWVGAPPRAVRHATSQPYVGPNGPLWPRLGVGTAASGRYLADQGYRGREWAAHWLGRYGALVRTRAAYATDNTVARRSHASLRQIVETVNGALKQHFGLTVPGAKTVGGLQARVAAKLAACNLGMVLNHRYHRPALAFATLTA
jgi:hypothetical protein